MNVTSMLSSGYLQPYRESVRPVDEMKAAAAMSAQEQQILAQEQALKTTSGPDAKVSTTYRYSAGPDGRRYISGAVVSVEGGSQQGSGTKNVTLGEAGKKAEPGQEAGKEAASGSPDKAKGSDQEMAAEIRELKRVEQEVVAHEAAHQAAGGALAGAASYTYTKGPDGKSYITGGEVSISTPPSSDPEETLRNMQTVQRAALAPGSPSGQDLSVASGAAAKATAARQELAEKNRESVSGSDSSEPGAAKGIESEKGAGFSSGVSSVKAGLLFDRIHGQNYGQEVSTSEESADGAASNPIEAYAQNASAYGLWTTMRGFEPAQKNLPFKPVLNIAA